MEYALLPLTNSLGFLTRVVQIQLVERVRASGGLCMSPACLAMLQLIMANPGIRQVHVARILLFHESNLASLVKDLLAQGLVERHGEGQGKRRGLWITEEGRRTVEQAAPTTAIERAYAAVLSEKEYQQLLGLLNRLYRASLT